MSVALEKRLLQAIVVVACLVPLTTGGASVLRGAAAVSHGAVAIDLDSHFRYLSGIFLGVGIAFASCVPAIEDKGARFRMLGGFVILGGLARLLSLIEVGQPSTGHLLGLCMELGVVPLLLVWQAAFARRYRGGSAPSPTSAVGR